MTMTRRKAALWAAMAAGAPLVSACATTAQSTPPSGGGSSASTQPTYSEDEIIRAASGFFGVGAEAVGAAVERVFRDQGRPVGYIQGEEASGAIGVGLRYGQGQLILRSGERRAIFWTGPSVGFDLGGNASKVFTLVYGLADPERIYQRFPGVDGSAYFIAGIGVNYQQADNIVLAPMRAGVGFRAGASVGYLAYSRKFNPVPF